MSEITNQLVATGRRYTAPASAIAAFVLGAALFVGHGSVHAASAAVAPMDDTSVNALSALDQAMEAVTSRVSPAVVNVAVTSRGSEEEQAEGQQQMQGLPPGLEQFFGGGGRPRQQQPQLEHGIGSGVIISPDGYIVTNNHVVDGAVTVKVTLHDRRVLNARVIGVDKLTDLAVVKVDAKDLPSIAWGDSTKLKPGQTVLAFGSPFGYFQDSVTRGIVSAVNRQDPYSTDARKPGSYIQSDAAINPGNSGGPLVNAHGELVGINTLIISNSGQFAGAGFAIPSQIVRATAEQLIRNGKVEHGYLGISMNDVTPANAHFFNLQEASGAIVADVTPDSPASRGGLKQGDVIQAVNGQSVTNSSALQVQVSEMQPGQRVNMNVLRDGKQTSLSMTLGEFNARAAQVAANGAPDGPQSGKLGIGVADLSNDVREQLQVPDQLHGVVVESVRPASPAEDAGLERGDVILEVNRKPAPSAQQFASAVHAQPGQDLLLLVWSHGNASYRTLRVDGSNG